VCGNGAESPCAPWLKVPRRIEEHCAMHALESDVSQRSAQLSLQSSLSRFLLRNPSFIVRVCGILTYLPQPASCRLAQGLPLHVLPPPFLSGQSSLTMCYADGENISKNCLIAGRANVGIVRCIEKLLIACASMNLDSCYSAR
jgi:hypothetical protein